MIEYHLITKLKEEEGGVVTAGLRHQNDMELMWGFRESVEEKEDCEKDVSVIFIKIYFFR